MAQTRLINKESVKGIMNKRTVATSSLVGKKISLTVQGNGNVIDVKNKEGVAVQSLVEPGTVFQKKIFNTKSNSQIAMMNDRNKELFSAGRKAEAAGDLEGAHKAYSDFLNSVQLSFSVPTTSPIANLLSSGTDISAELIRVDTENGSLLTIDPATIRILEPEALGRVEFSYDDEPAVEETASAVEALKA